MANQAQVNEKLAARVRAKTDKMFLACEVLGYDFVPEVHKELFDCYIPFDEKKAWREQSDVKDRLVIWSRGFFKSTSIVVECIQAILNFPDIRILIQQGSIATTQNLLHEIKSHFLGISPRSKFRDLFPEFCANELGSVNKFITPARVQKQLQQATVTVASPRSIKTGQHFDALFADDLVNESNFSSAKKIKKTKDEFRACIPLIDPGGYRYVSGTRYAFGDLYEEIIRGNENNQWKITVKDCYSDNGKDVRFPARVLADGRIIGFTKDGLLQIQREDPIMFSAQYLNKPSHGGVQLFTEEKMLAAMVSEKDVPALSAAVLFVDLASSQAIQADDSVILCGKTDHLRNMYVVDGTGGAWTPAVLALKIIEMAMKHKPIRILIEKTASSAYFVEYLKILCRDKEVVLPIDYIPVNNSKDAKYIRISGLEGHIRSRRLRFFVGLECMEKLMSQFIEFPKARFSHDDYPDTVALMAQVFGAQGGLVTPLSAHRHPLLAEMERQSQEVNHLFEAPRIAENEMGAEFE